MDKNRIPDDASPEFKQVMKAVREGDPAFKKAQAAELKRVKAARAALVKHNKKKNRRNDGGNDVVDTGMFR